MPSLSIINCPFCKDNLVEHRLGLTISYFLTCQNCGQYRVHLNNDLPSNIILLLDTLNIIFDFDFKTTKIIINGDLETRKIITLPLLDYSDLPALKLKIQKLLPFL